MVINSLKCLAVKLIGNIKSKWSHTKKNQTSLTVIIPKNKTLHLRFF